MTENLKEQSLVLRAQLGDESALSALIKRWRPGLITHAIRISGRGDLAADAVQEALLTVCEKLKQLRDPRLAKSWAYKIVTNKCMDQIRNESKQNAIQAQHVGLADAHDDNVNDYGFVWRLMTKNERVLLSLRFGQDMSVTEIAAVLGIPRGTVKSRLFYARRRLKRLLKGEGDV